MRVLLIALLTALIVVLAPGAAGAATCGVPQSEADYERPDLQVHVHRMTLVACRRATGKVTQIGVRFKDGMGTYQDSYVLDVFGGRWVWVLGVGTAAESGDAYDHTVIDLRTGTRVNVTTQSDYDPPADAVGVPGALVVADAGGVKARFTDGHIETLSTVPGAYDVAAVGNRVYLAHRRRHAHRDAEAPRTRRPAGGAAGAHHRALQAARGPEAADARRRRRGHARRRRHVGVQRRPDPGA